jgi:hypothetical protein
MGHWCRICGRILANEDIAAKARLILEIGLICPYKRRRLKVLARTRRDLIEKLEETGLIFAHHY